MYKDMIKTHGIPLSKGTTDRIWKLFCTVGDANNPDIQELVQKVIYEYLDAVDALSGNPKLDLFEENKILALVIQKCPKFEDELAK